MNNRNLHEVTVLFFMKQHLEQSDEGLASPQVSFGLLSPGRSSLSFIVYEYCIFGLVLHLYCHLFLFLLFYVICAPVPTEQTTIPLVCTGVIFLQARLYNTRPL